jgi:hypothetical protein
MSGARGPPKRYTVRGRGTIRTRGEYHVNGEPP